MMLFRRNSSCEMALAGMIGRETGDFALKQSYRDNNYRVAMGSSHIKHALDQLLHPNRKPSCASMGLLCALVTYTSLKSCPLYGCITVTTLIQTSASSHGTWVLTLKFPK